MKRRKGLSEKEIHNSFWKDIRTMVLKYGSLSFVIIFGVLEFCRRWRLHEAWVPIFVFDSEPLLTNYTYAKTISLWLLYLPGLWLMFIGIEHVFLYKKWWKRTLSGLLFLVGAWIWGISMLALFAFDPPIKWPLYVSKDYIVEKTSTGLEVRFWDNIFLCTKKNPFEDVCEEKWKLKNP